MLSEDCYLLEGVQSADETVGRYQRTNHPIPIDASLIKREQKVMKSVG